MKERWDKAVSVATIFSLVAVPVVLGIGGWLIQDRIAEQSSKREYGQLAVSILCDVPNKEDKEAQALRKWAVSLVNGNAPIKLSNEGQIALYVAGLPSEAAWVSPGISNAHWIYSPPQDDCATLAEAGDKTRADECIKLKQQWLEFQQLTLDQIVRERKSRTKSSSAGV